MQFSLRTVFLLITVLAVFFASLGFPRPLVASLVYSFAVAALALGAIAAVCYRDLTRAGWAGFSIVVFIYFLVTLWARTPDNPMLVVMMPSQSTQLITDWAVDWLYLQIHSFDQSAPITTGTMSPMLAGIANHPQLYKLAPTYSAFWTIGHAGVGLMLGACGALFATWLASARSTEGISKKALLIRP